MVRKIIFSLLVIYGALIILVMPIYAEESTGSDNPDAHRPTTAAVMPSPAEFPSRRIESQPTFSETQAITADASGRITLELKGMDILDALKLLSKKSSLNIAAGKNVRGNITIYLKEVDVWDALRIILEINDLAYEKEGNIIKVMTARDYELIYGKKFGDKTEVKVINLKFAQAIDLAIALNQIKSSIGKVVTDEKSNTLLLIDTPSKLEDMQRLVSEADVDTVTQVFDLKYTKAEDLEKKISEILTKGLGRIRMDARTNKVVITDSPKKMAEIEKIINAFDERHKEVLIEAKIIKILLDDSYKMGVDWEFLLSNYHNLGFKSSFGLLTDTDKKGKISIGTLADDEYSAFMEALNTIGTTNILSNPSIAALNNEEAKILVGSTEPYITTTTTTPASGPTTTAETVNFIDVGIKLYVVPIINEDNFITMKIKPEVSSVTGYLTTGQNNKIPIKETSEAETRVMVKDGVTIVIGGLMKNEDLETLKKVPFLGDLPLLSWLFRSKDKTVKKSELVVLLTPHIMSGDIDSYGATKSISYTPASTSEVEAILLEKEKKGLKAQAVEPDRKALTAKKDDMPQASISYEQYCQAIKDKIYKYIEKNYPEESIIGRVELSFTVLSSGGLKEEPAVNSEADIRLKSLAIKSLKEALPFGPFPRDAGKEEETFHLAISYE